MPSQLHSTKEVLVYGVLCFREYISQNFVSLFSGKTQENIIFIMEGGRETGRKEGRNRGERDEI